MITIRTKNNKEVLIMFKTDTLIWAKDGEGHRHLCPMGELADANFVSDIEKKNCVADDGELKSWRTVPSNDELGRLKFPRSASLN
jgi:hypothetical protein